LASSQIFQRTIIREKLRARKPDIYIECPVDNFTVLDFHRYAEVMKAALPIKDQLKRQIERLISSEPVETLPAPLQVALAEQPAAPERPKRQKFEKAKALMKRRGRKNR